MDYKVAVFIGRFQPFHRSHLEVVKQGLQIADKVVIIVGSHCSTLTPKNPWTFEQRKAMIEDSVSGLNLTTEKPQFGQIDQRLIVEPIRDYYEQDSYWVAEVQNIVSKYTDPGDSIALLGSYKDGSSYYINYFKEEWDFIPSRSDIMMDATDVRKSLFEGTEDWKEMVPYEVAKWIELNYIEDLMPTFEDKPKPSTGYRYQVDQFQALKDYKAHWGAGPFVTADAVVIQSGHVLLVKRKGKLGTGRLALPGGFLKNTERIEDAALRELKEETSIRLDKEVLRGCIVASRVFDFPGRSLNGRVITHAYAIKLRDNKLVEVKGSDDAEVALWMSFNDINKNEDLFYDDHIHIIRYFMSQI